MSWVEAWWGCNNQDAGDRILYEMGQMGSRKTEALFPFLTGRFWRVRQVKHVVGSRAAPTLLLEGMADFPCLGRQSLRATRQALNLEPTAALTLTFCVTWPGAA